MARIEAVWQDDSGTSRVSHGKLEDLSDGGLSIRIQDAIGLGTRLVIRMPLGNFPGTVVRSRCQGHDYILGIKRDSARKLATG